MSDTYDYLIKTVIVGDSGIGKSSIMIRFAEDIFNYHYISTIGVDFKLSTIKYKNKSIKFQIWDTAGQDRFRTITSTYYRGSQGTIICYDITDRNTFNSVIKWLEEVKKYSINEPILILCGTKADLESEREVSLTDGLEFAKLHNMKFFETSAKDNKNIKEIFEFIAENKLHYNSFINFNETYQQSDLRKRSKVLLFDSKENKQEKKSCC